MAKKDLKKKKKRKQAALARKNRQCHVVSFFKYSKDIPHDMVLELKKIVKKVPISQWVTKDGRDFFAALGALLDEIVHTDAFDRYFPRYTLTYEFGFDKCTFKLFKLKRIMIGKSDYYMLPSDIKLPLCGGRKVIFSKHALERLVVRFFSKDKMIEAGMEDLSMVPISPSLRALHFPLILSRFKKSDFETTIIKDGVFLHSFGFIHNGEELCRGHFPIVYEKEYAIAKTFLYDDWLGSTVTN